MFLFWLLLFATLHSHHSHHKENNDTCVSGGLGAWTFLLNKKTFAKPFFDVRVIGYQYLSKYWSVLLRVKKADIPEMSTFWILLYKKRQNYPFKGQFGCDTGGRAFGAKQAVARLAQVDDNFD